LKLGRWNLDPLLVLLVFVPVAATLETAHADPVWIFATRRSPSCRCWPDGTRNRAAGAAVGCRVGGLLNASFGNAAELIIALMALRAGLYTW